jgi:hypothetical protein
VGKRVWNEHVDTKTDDAYTDTDERAEAEPGYEDKHRHELKYAGEARDGETLTISDSDGEG